MSTPWLYIFRLAFINKNFSLAYASNKLFVSAIFLKRKKKHLNFSSKKMLPNPINKRFEKHSVALDYIKINV